MSSDRVILFAGGGSGGHIFPNVAVLERLREFRVPVGPHFVVSDRPLDAQIVKRMGYPFTPLSAQPLNWHPAKLWDFWQALKLARLETHDAIRRTGARALIATGGFVAAPALLAAKEAGIPCALVNLDAVPGKANQRMARHADTIFSVYPTPMLPRAQSIGMPLRRSSLSDMPANRARAALGLMPGIDTIFITAGSQGATSINKMMIELCTRTEARKTLAEWQVLHLTGDHDRGEVAAAYEQAGIRAVVQPFCGAMGLAWRSATLAISRAGAGSVAEAWAAATPTVFFPYPYHKDEHQRRNCEPLVNAGSALLMKDQVDPVENASRLMGALFALMRNTTQRDKMRTILQASPPPDGAQQIARWLMMQLGIRYNP